MSLFKIKDTEKFGTVLATDSKGMKVFEVKGGGIEVVKADQIEEVLPFTFSVSFDQSQNASAKEYHFFGEEGQFKIGDLLIYDQGFHLGFCRVTGLDTKNRKATKQFSGYKLAATPINATEQF